MGVEIHVAKYTIICNNYLNSGRFSKIQFLLKENVYSLFDTYV